MKLTRLLNRSLGLALCAAALAIGSPASAQTTITALTGGDSDEGLNLTGLNVIYAINQGLSPTAETIQGVNFIAAPINLFTFTGYGGNVVLSNLNRTGPGFSPVGWGSTANDLAMIAVNGQISYGSFGQFAYAVTAGNQYTVFSIISPGSIGGRPGDVAFFGGLASSFSQGTTMPRWFLIPTPQRRRVSILSSLRGVTRMARLLELTRMLWQVVSSWLKPFQNPAPSPCSVRLV